MSTQWNDSVLKMDGSLVVMIVLVLVLMYQVFIVDRADINYLKMAHSKEGFNDNRVMDAYANRFGTVLTSYGGPPAEGGFDTTGAGARIPYGQSNKSSFLGGGEPPVFYDIGNLRAMKANADATGYTYKTRQNRGSIQQVPVVPAMPVVSSADKVAAAIEGLWMGTDQQHNNELSVF